MSADYVLCDVFTDRPFAGNQLAVFPSAEGISAAAMAALAREFTWQEITFVLPAVRGGDARVRIWTPEGELPFAGHPTVGTAVVLATLARIEPGVSTLELGIGPVSVEVTLDERGGSATMTQRAPEFGAIHADRAGVAAALGLDESDLAPDLPIQRVSTGLAHFLVPLRNQDALTRARAAGDSPAPPLAGNDLRWMYCFTVDTPGSSAGARARLLAPGLEDPATGSAAGPLGAYLVYYGAHRPGRIDIEQGIEMGRPSLLSVDVEREGGTIGPVRVSGQVCIWGQGSVEDAALQ